MSYRSSTFLITSRKSTNILISLISSIFLIGALNAQVTPPNANSDADCGADCWDFFNWSPVMDSGGNVVAGEGVAEDNNCNTIIDAGVEYVGMDSNGPDYSGTAVGANLQGVSVDEWTFTFGTPLTNPVFGFGALRTNTIVSLFDCNGTEITATCISSCGVSYTPGVGWSGDASYQLQLSGTFDCVVIMVDVQTANDNYNISVGTCLGANPPPPCVNCPMGTDFDYISLTNYDNMTMMGDVEVNNVKVGTSELIFSDLDIATDFSGTAFGAFDNDGGTFIMKIDFCQPLDVTQLEIKGLETESQASIGTTISGSGASATLGGLTMTHCGNTGAAMEVEPVGNLVINSASSCANQGNGEYTIVPTTVSTLYFKYHNPPGGCVFDKATFKVATCTPDVNASVVPACPLTLVTFTDDVDAYIMDPNNPANSYTALRDANGLYFNNNSCPNSIPTNTQNPIIISACDEVVDEEECTVCVPTPPCAMCPVNSDFEYIRLTNYDNMTMMGDIELGGVVVGSSELIFSDLDIREDFSGTTFGGFDNDGGTLLMKLEFCEEISVEELVIRNLEVESQVSVGTSISGMGAAAVLSGLSLTQCDGSSRMGVGPAPNEVITDGPGCGANPNGVYLISPNSITTLYFKYHNPPGGCSFDYVGFKIGACVPDLPMVVPTCPMVLYEVMDPDGSTSTLLQDGMGHFFNDNSCPTTLPTAPQQSIAVSPCATLTPLVDCEVCVPTPMCSATNCPTGTSFDYINFKSGEAILGGGNVGTISLLYSDLDVRTDVHGTTFGGFDRDGGTMVMRVDFCAPITIHEVDVVNLEVDSEIEVGTSISGSGKSAVLGGLDLVTCSDPSGRMGPSVNPGNTWKNFVKTDGPGCGANPNGTYNFTTTMGGLVGGSITTNVLYFKYNNPETGTANDDTAYDLIWGEDCSYDYVGFRIGYCAPDPGMRTEACPWDKYIMETPGQSIPVWVDANGSMYECDHNGGPKASDSGYLFEMTDLPPVGCLPVSFCLVLEDQYEPNNNWFYVDMCDAPDATATPFGTAVPECPLEVFEVIPQCLQTDCSYGTATVVANPEVTGAGTYTHDFWLVIPGGVDCWHMRLRNVSNIDYMSFSIGSTHSDLIMLAESDGPTVSFCGAIPCAGGTTTPCGDVVVAARLVYDYDGSGSANFENILRWDAPGTILTNIDCQYISSVNPVALGYMDCPGATPITVVKDNNGNYFDYAGNMWPADVTGLTDAFDKVFVSSCDDQTALCTDPSFTDPKGVCSICVIPGLAKAVTNVTGASSGIAGNVDVTYKFTLVNYGGANMENLVITDDFTGFAGYVGVTSTPIITMISAGATAPNVNNSWNGSGNLFDGSSGSLVDGQQLMAEVVIEFDASDVDPNEVNVAQGGGTPPGGGALLLDDSVSGIDPDPDGDGDPSNNGDATGANGGGTPLYFPAINAAKDFVDVVPASSGTFGNYDATVQIVVENTGNIDLMNLSLVDDLSVQLTGAFVGLVTSPSIILSTATTNPNLNGGYNGSGNNDIFDGMSGLMMPGESLTVEFIIEINPNASTVYPINNQATASGTGVDPATGGPLLDPNGDPVVVSDDSDSGTDPDSQNPGHPGDTGGSNDPSPLLIPRIDMTKDFVSLVQTPCQPAGNVNVRFNVKMQNTGSVPLTNLVMQDDLQAQFGTSFVQVVNIVVLNSDATVTPSADNTFNGNTNVDLIDGSLAILEPNQQVTVAVTIELNPNEPGAPKIATNQAYGSADGHMFDQIVITVEDLSDSGIEGNHNNPGEPGDTGGYDDPTPFPLANLNSAKDIVDISPAASGVVGNVDMTYQVTIQNTGNVDITNLNAFDNPASGFGCTFVGVISGPSLISSTATSTPGLNGAYDGIVSSNLLSGNGLLECDQIITIEYAIELSPNLPCAPESMCNQANVSGQGMGSDGNLETVFDLSDWGSTPDEFGMPNDPCSDNCTPFPADCWAAACSSFSCNNSLNLTANNDCQIEINASMLIEGVDSECLGDGIFPSMFEILLFDENGDPIPTEALTGGVIVDADLVLERTITVSVVTPCYGNTCWGEIFIEDKTEPTVECDCPVGGEDLDGDGIVDGYAEECTLTCWELPLLKENYWDRLRDNLVPEMVDDFIDDHTSDNCDGTIAEDDVSYYDVYIDLGPCTGTLLRRTWTLNYDNGNGGSGSVSCTREYFFKPVGLETLIEARRDPVTGAFEVIEDTLLLPPRLVELNCGADISPAGIAAYFDDPGTTDNDTDDDRLDPDELDIDVVVENNEGVPYAYPHYYIEGRNPSGPHAQAIDNEVCNIIVAYTDQEIEACAPGCSGNRKVLRNWTVLDWCSGLFVEHEQIIKSIDTGNPSLIVHDVTASVDPWKCSADVPLPHPEHIYDDCETITVYSIGTVEGALTVTGNYVDGFYLHDVPNGETITVEYLVEDCCGNIGRTYVNVSVSDQTAPVPVTKEFIVLSLTNIANPVDANQGIAKLYAEDVDNGSYDGCTGIDLAIRRTGAVCPGETNDWADFVKFCCEDLDGQAFVEIDVQFRVRDAYGNTNYAWSTVRLEDKSNTTQTCPPDVVLTCDMDYNDFTMTGLPRAYSACGEIDLMCDPNELIEDTEPRRKGPNDGFFNDPRYDGVEVPAYDPSCGYGAVRRQFKSCSSCTQWFVIEPIDAFNPNTITFPADIVVDCDAWDTGEPDWEPATCNLVGVSLESDTFLFEDGACYKILNHWSVINWCTYDPTDPYTEGRYEHTQVIKIIDTQDPVLTVADSLCFGVDVDCVSAGVEMSASGNDEGNCGSEWLKWEVTIDLYSDWTSDMYFGTDLPRLVNGVANPYYIAPTGNDELATITLPDGIPSSKAWHRAVWRLYDGCGNNVSSVRYFQITDKKAPTPYCLNLSTAVMSTDGTVELWAIDFNVGSWDNCTDSDDLIFTFTEVAPPGRDDTEYDSSSDLEWYNGTFWYYDSETGEYQDQDDYGDEVHRWEPGLRSAGKVFTIDDADASGFAQIPIYVWDECGNTDFCLVNLRIIDNMGIGEGRIAGQILTEEGAEVEGVMTELMSDSPEYPLYNMTDATGKYSFNDLPMSADYAITASKTDDYLNGVSTLDLLLIQRHILGQEQLSSAYKMIAADVNNDKDISAVDMIELRKLILGVYDELPSNTSWKAVDASQTLTTVNPWIYKESLSVYDLQTQMEAEDFVGVKIGDVNGSAEANFRTDKSERSSNVLELNYADGQVEEGEVIEVVMTSGSEALYGYQFTMDLRGMELVEVRGENITEGNVAVFNGKMTMSYNNLEALSQDAEIFTMVLKATESGLVSDMIGMNSGITKAEAYVGESLEVVSLDLRNVEGEGRFALYQNQPNPFTEYTVIGYEIPTSGQVTISFYDVTGRVLNVIEKESVSGYNEVKVNRSDLGTVGMIYYKLESKEHTATQHMMLIE